LGICLKIMIYFCCLSEGELWLKLSSVALSKIANTFSLYDISNSSLDIKARAFQNVYKPAVRAGMGQFFTPHEVVKLIVDVISPKQQEVIIDPFCGSGHFLSESLSHLRSQVKNCNVFNEFAYHKLHGIEKSERMVRIAMTDMRLNGDGHSNIRCTDALLPFSSYVDIEPNSFDVVMTNPPFGSVLSSDAFNYLGEFELNSLFKNVPLELAGLERSIQLLRDGGKLGIILPESIFVNKSFYNIRKWISQKLKVRAIVSLPIETFSPYGTSIKTSILFAKKERSDSVYDYKIFTGGIENIGYDAAGRPLENGEINAFTARLQDFFRKEGW